MPGTSTASMASQLCLLPQMTRSKPGAPGSAVPQMPYVARPASLSSTPLSDPFRVASRPSDSTPIASQRYHDCPASDCCTVGLNQTVESMLSRRARSSPPTYDVNRRGQSVASWRRTRVGVDREQVAVDDGVEGRRRRTSARSPCPEQETGLLRLVGATASSYASR